MPMDCIAAASCRPSPFPQCVNKGAVEPLIKLLASSDETCICEAADTLEILAGCDEGVT